MNDSSFTDTLPPYLAERVTPFSRGELRGEFVLYLMRTALRDHENPALDVALVAAGQLGLPVFVLQVLAGSYPYASDRHHTFVMESARDVARGLAEKGVGYAFHLERSGHLEPVLPQLCARAALVVTEHMPVAPFEEATRRLAERSAAPVLCIDTSCVVPMRLTERAYPQLFRFREATMVLRGERVERPWPTPPAPDRPFLPELPFEPVPVGELSDIDIAELVAKCDIDHGVAPVAQTCGGSRAGYARWRHFVDAILPNYADRHSDPLARSTSRLSPHLHYGTVSPMRIAREVSAIGGRGAEKFLEHLLGWRELSYHLCFHEARHGSFDILPDWARSTWRRHESDTRPRLLSWETLARGRTGDGLWDAAQTSLLIHGELHNDLRMMWGKALADWTPTVDRAIDLAMDLNHRYALDGGDPASYGGVLSCFGLFDRPNTPPSPVTGLVRPRWSVEYSKPLDVGRYRATVMRSSVASSSHIAVIGAGMAGLACARTLRDHGLQVTVLEKSRGPGGRMSTRREEEYCFDHGAQHFTASDPRFARYVASWCADGVAAPWTARIATLKDQGPDPHDNDQTFYVGTPRMSAITRHLSRELGLRYGVRVASLKREATTWDLYDQDRTWLGAYDLVVIAVPAPQAVPLLAAAPPLAEVVEGARMAPCWAAMLRFDGPLGLPYDAAQTSRGGLEWLARDASKPGRNGEHSTWVLHATPGWSQEHLESDPEEIAGLLGGEFLRVTGSAARLVWSQAHRWRYARVISSIGRDCLFDETSQ